MRIQKLMEEYGYELDDIRWYLAEQTANKLLSYRDNTPDLIRLIWRGSLSDELYDMEERFLGDLEADLANGTIDEAQVRGIFTEIDASLNRRE